MSLDNVYDNRQRAASYARLEFPGTYYLAFRNMPGIISEYVDGKTALDFGCGAGRSTRFLQKLGFDTVGVDISPEMVHNARRLDGSGKYFVINEGDLTPFEEETYDLVFSAFTFDNIPTDEMKLKNLSAIERLLKPDGLFINLVSSPEIYLHEWSSFTTKDFPDNHQARSGDGVKIIMKDVNDRRPVEDTLFTDDSYRELYLLANLKLQKTFRPLAKENEPFDWITETKLAPWTIYVLNPQ